MQLGLPLTPAKITQSIRNSRSAGGGQRAWQAAPIPLRWVQRVRSSVGVQRSLGQAVRAPGTPHGPFCLASQKVPGTWLGLRYTLLRDRERNQNRSGSGVEMDIVLENTNQSGLWKCDSSYRRTRPTKDGQGAVCRRGMGGRGSSCPRGPCAAHAPCPASPVFLPSIRQAVAVKAYWVPAVRRQQTVGSIIDTVPVLTSRGGD